MDPKLIVDSVTVLCGFGMTLGAAYAVYAKHQDARVKVARENTLGAELAAQLLAKQNEHGQAIEQLRGSDTAQRQSEERRDRDTQQMLRDLKDLQAQIARRMQKNDDRVIKVLEDLASRNPYGVGRGRRGGGADRFLADDNMTDIDQETE